jgi:hypothetical protein
VVRKLCRSLNVNETIRVSRNPKSFSHQEMKVGLNVNTFKTKPENRVVKANSPSFHGVPHHILARLAVR